MHFMHAMYKSTDKHDKHLDFLEWKTITTRCTFFFSTIWRFYGAGFMNIRQVCLAGLSRHSAVFCLAAGFHCSLCNRDTALITQ